LKIITFKLLEYQHFINNYYCFCKNKFMICLNTFVFIKLLDFVLIIKYALYIAANYMKVLTIPEEKYF